jgi:hypothetical protein
VILCGTITGGVRLSDSYREFPWPYRHLTERERSGTPTWAGHGGVRTRVTEPLVDEVRKGFWVFGAGRDTEAPVAEGYGKAGLPPPCPLPWCWEGDIPPLDPARQLSARCRYTTY